MPEPATPLGPEAVGITERTLFLKIWRHPTATLGFILANCPGAYVTQLLVLGGIARAVGRIKPSQVHDASSAGNALLLAALLGGAFGWVTYYFYAWGLSLCGQWMGGRATADTLKTVLAWALVPTIVSLAPMCLVLDISSGDSFRREVIDLPLSNETLLYALSGLELGLAVWTFCIFLSGIRLVQGFAVGRAVLNMVLPGATLVLFVGGIMLLMKALETAVN
ncbi:YIP1 family protein [Hymenobacter cheonanensis]|uniref:YIP1 family protein n=1 Tax=Hymenobacter sp. CA2-7 TaxID=3063993 RepID=UPI002712DA7F|nr:YIP1 family protein [Hymenobacter sp. CA2-7]MDO7884952.1 hypothetical protein [Hymenobacter sp. CA2-7]